jgi:hypothetical protein
MNVVSTGIVNRLKLELKSLSEVEFQALSMKIADHRKTVLYH